MTDEVHLREFPYLPCVVAAECELLALVIHKETTLHSDEGVRACIPKSKSDQTAMMVGMICQKPIDDHTCHACILEHRSTPLYERLAARALQGEKAHQT